MGRGVRVEVTAGAGQLQAELERLGSAVQDAANAAVVRQTAETKDLMRGQVAAKLSPRAANALRSKEYVNAPNSGLGVAGEVAGFIYSAWWRKDRKGGDNVDMFAAFERGDVVYAPGKQLAIPLPAAYQVVGLPRTGRGRKRPTPQDVEAALDTDLFVLRRGGGRASLLCARGVVRGAPSGRKGARPIRAARYRNRKGGLTVRRGASAELIALFVLLRTARLPRRLNFAGIEGRSADRLAEKVLIEMGRRGLG